jgi:hypothetical protein
MADRGRLFALDGLKQLRPNALVSRPGPRMSREDAIKAAMAYPAGLIIGDFVSGRPLAPEPTGWKTELRREQVADVRVAKTSRRRHHQIPRPESSVVDVTKKKAGSCCG